MTIQPWQDDNGNPIGLAGSDPKEILGSTAQLLQCESPLSERIPVVLGILEAFWYEHPDWRLGELLFNICHATEGGHLSPFDRLDDLRTIEDDELLQRLECLKKTY